MSEIASNISQNSSNESKVIPNLIPNEEYTIRVLTLNCWGLWVGAKKRRQRIEGIVRYLRENNCDIVFLQEVWVTSDFELIRDGTSDVYRFIHLFRSGSVLGSSGIVILCKWLPKVIHFEPYSLNGSPFYPWHGDWFAGKGIAYARVDFDGLSLHLFSTHTHAYYNENEPVHHQYSVHRICQSYQLAKFITFISDTACNRKASGKDLLVVAGDMNTTSTELPYKILTTMAGLTDCFKLPRNNNTSSNIIHRHKLLNLKQKLSCVDSGSTSSINSQEKNAPLCPNKASDNFLLDTLEEYGSKVAHALFDSDTEDEDITYCHPRNSFTPGPLEYKWPMKRIDFILCRLLTHGHCVVDRISSESKDPTLDCSLSDHEPVMVELKICDINHDLLIKNDCNTQVMETTQDILKQYYHYNRMSKTQLLYVVLFMFIVTLPTTTYYALSNEYYVVPLSTVIFVWLAACFLFAIFLLIGFLSYRYEQGAIEAILNDIACKISVAKEHQPNDKSFYEYR